MKQLGKLFHIEYGNQFDLNKMDIENIQDGTTVNFVSRSGRNLGISAIVKKIPRVEPYFAGKITVALGGSILSSFVQPRDFYTGQNVMVLTPRVEMTFQEKIYYCLCIKRNDFRYSTFGREANRTLSLLKMPSKVPKWINDIDFPLPKIQKIIEKI